MPDTPHAELIDRKPGVYVVGGQLFFKLASDPHSSLIPRSCSISCTCIGEPYASEIAALFAERPK